MDRVIQPVQMVRKNWIRLTRDSRIKSMNIQQFYLGQRGANQCIKAMNIPRFYLGQKGVNQTTWIMNIQRFYLGQKG